MLFSGTSGNYVRAALNRCQTKFLTSVKISGVLLFVSYFASQSKEIKFGDYFFDVFYVN